MSKLSNLATCKHRNMDEMQRLWDEAVKEHGLNIPQSEAPVNRLPEKSDET